jgi:hypothetical protein
MLADSPAVRPPRLRLEHHAGHGQRLRTLREQPVSVQMSAAAVAGSSWRRVVITALMVTKPF